MYVGVFMEEIECEFAWIQHRIYAHQKYIRLLVNDIYAWRKENTQGGVLYLDYFSKFSGDPESPDIDFGSRQSHLSNWLVPVFMTSLLKNI